MVQSHVARPACRYSSVVAAPLLQGGNRGSIPRTGTTGSSSRSKKLYSYLLLRFEDNRPTARERTDIAHALLGVSLPVQESQPKPVARRKPADRSVGYGPLAQLVRAFA